jgi:hypothetical protein
MSRDRTSEPIGVAVTAAVIAAIATAFVASAMWGDNWRWTDWLTIPTIIATILWTFALAVFIRGFQVARRRMRLLDGVDVPEVATPARPTPPLATDPPDGGPSFEPQHWAKPAPQAQRPAAAPPQPGPVAVEAPATTTTPPQQRAATTNKPPAAPVRRTMTARRVQQR